MGGYSQVLMYKKEGICSYVKKARVDIMITIITRDATAVDYQPLLNQGNLVLIIKELNNALLGASINWEGGRKGYYW